MAQLLSLSLSMALYFFLPLPVQAWETTGEIGGELRYFVDEPLGSEQFDDGAVAAYLQPELYHSWDGGQSVLALELFGRLDQHDQERSHADIRELYWERRSDFGELRVGISKVFWGVTEAQHLVDIINQTDLVENFDGEDKFGQPMLRYSKDTGIGRLELYVMSGFRERSFPGLEGRPGAQVLVDTNAAQYESGARYWRGDVALRWSAVFGDWDVGLSHFYGTSRETRLLLDRSVGSLTAFNPNNPNDNSNATIVLRPLYEIINQTGIDVQATLGAWLLKLEAIRRVGQGESFFAATTGIEYSFYSLFGSELDVGVLLEYLFDERDGEFSEPFSLVATNNDVFLGARLGFNDVQDSQLLFGCIRDVDTTASSCFVEGSRRLGERWTASLQVRSFNNIPIDHPFASVRQDDHVQLEFTWHY